MCLVKVSRLEVAMLSISLCISLSLVCVCVCVCVTWLRYYKKREADVIAVVYVYRIVDLK